MRPSSAPELPDVVLGRWLAAVWITGAEVRARVIEGGESHRGKPVDLALKHGRNHDSHHREPRRPLG